MNFFVFQVSSLDLSRNSFDGIPPALSTFSFLKYLNLSHNKISTLGYGDFSKLQHLERLDLSFNFFRDWKDIVAESFKPLPKLMFLDLSSNPLRIINQYSNHFNLKSLEILKLNNCSLMNIYPEIFESSSSLKELYLSYNPVKFINGSFNLRNVKLLDLSHCKLTFLDPNIFRNMPNLEILRLHNNKFLRKLIVNLINVYILDLSQCNVENIPSGALETVVSLKLEGNFLKTIRDNSFMQYSNLSRLNLSSNAITSLSTNAFKGLDNLKIMDLSENKITTISEKLFLPTIALEELILSHNYISRLDDLTSSSIKILDASYCEIYGVSEFSLGNLPKLNRLSLSRNFISSIPDRWTGDRLVSLDLSRCRIRTINNRTFEKMLHLKSIDISGNQLTSVEVSNFIHATNINLEDNPWNCECSDLEDLYTFLIFSGTSGNNLICDSPAKFQGQTWEDACIQEWHRAGKKSKQIWWYSIVVIASLGLLLGAVTILKKMNDMRENRIREEEQQRALQERQAREALERMQRLQREFVEEADRNAPDPRESQGPPSYTDALLLPRLDASHPSLAGSLYSITGSNSSLNKKGRNRRKRRRRRSEEKRQSRTSVDDSDTSDNGRPGKSAPLESDF